ncbi:MAG: tetratricopeptide repeat protein [Chloroflexi bacterium]|nr:tetratricopeptide repeat protein [Chloroflexota bacterium]
MNSDPLLAAYIPLDRRLALRDGRDLPAETHGTAVFADVSGFTPLTVALLDEFGPKQGAELLTQHLNEVYDSLIGCVYQYRGVVITFAGDAITCWFDGDDGRSAIACGLAMQAAMSPFANLTTPAGTTIPLAIKVAIATGPARRFVVGDPDIQLLDVLVGDTLDKMAKVEKLADKGEILLYHDTAETLSAAGHVTLGAWRGEHTAALLGELLTPPEPNPWPAFEETLLPAEQSRPWLLPPLYRRLQEVQDILPEVRPVTVLFLQFEGLDTTHDPDVADKVDQYVRWVQQTLARYDGYLLQLMFGDKGCLFYATFGAPVAHEDNMPRAVAATRELLTLPPELRFIQKSKAGISQGRVYAGAYGGRARHTYGVLGSETNIAARFMSQAEPGQILVRQQVAEAVELLFRSKYLGQIYVKGVAKPVSMFIITEKVQMQSLNPSDIFTTPLVGRQLELTAAMACLERTTQQKGQVLDVVGHPGQGKSHFAAEVVDRAIGRGLRVAIGYGQAITQQTSYAPWRHIFRALLGMPEEAGMGEMTRTALARQMAFIQMQLTFLNPEWLVRLPLMGDLLGLPIPDTPATQPLTPQLRQESLFALALDMLNMWAEEQPLLLLLEDVQLFDTASVDLLKYIAQKLGDSPMALFMVRRPFPEIDDRLTPNLSYYTPILLGELARDEVAQIVRNQLHGEVTPLLVDVIQYQAQGNPFFVEELADLLRDAELASPDERKRWRLKPEIVAGLQAADCLQETADGEPTLRAGATLPELTIQLPDSMYASVLARLDKLPETHKLTLKVASVIGNSFELQVMNRVHPNHPSAADLRREAIELVAREFVRQSGGDEMAEMPAGEEIYAFKHNITHEVTYDTLLEQQRQQLHRIIAAVTEETQPDDASLIAYHAFKGADWEKALRYLLRAGQQARNLFANKEAITHLQRAQEAAKKLPAKATRTERLEIIVLLGEILVQLGRYDEATAQLEEGLKLAKQTGNAHGHMQVCRWLARRWELAGKFDEAWLWIERGLARLPGQISEAAAELLITAGLIHSRRGQQEEGQRLAEEALRMGWEMVNSNVLGRAYNLLGHLARLRGASETALQQFLAGLDLYEQAGNLHGAAMTHNQIANAYFGLGQWRQANTHYQMAQQMFQRIGDVYNRAFAENNLGQLALYRGQPEQALGLYQSVLGTFEQSGKSLYVLGVIEMNLGATYVKLNRPEQAEGHLQTAAQYFAQAEVRDFLPELHRHKALMQLGAGQLAEALQEGQTAVALARELGMAADEGTGLRILGQIQQAQGELATAEATLRQSLAILQGTDERYEQAQTQAVLAAVCEALGQGEKAAVWQAASQGLLVELGVG